jgi:hypothetical protein
MRIQSIALLKPMLTFSDRERDQAIDRKMGHGRQDDSLLKIWGSAEREFDR